MLNNEKKVEIYLSSENPIYFKSIEYYDLKEFITFSDIGRRFSRISFNTMLKLNIKSLIKDIILL